MQIYEFLNFIFFETSGQEAETAADGDAVAFRRKWGLVRQIFGGATFKEAQDGQGGGVVSGGQRRRRVQLNVEPGANFI